MKQNCAKFPPPLLTRYHYHPYSFHWPFVTLDEDFPPPTLVFRGNFAVILPPVLMLSNIHSPLGTVIKFNREEQGHFSKGVIKKRTWRPSHTHELTLSTGDPRGRTSKNSNVLIDMMSFRAFVIKICNVYFSSKWWFFDQRYVWEFLALRFF